MLLQWGLGSLMLRISIFLWAWVAPGKFNVAFDWKTRQVFTLNTHTVQRVWTHNTKAVGSLTEWMQNQASKKTVLCLWNLDKRRHIPASKFLEHLTAIKY